MVTMVVLLSLQRRPAKRPPKKERGFYATPQSGATFYDHPRNLRPPRQLSALRRRRCAISRGPRLAARKSGREPPTLQCPQQPPQPPALHALHDALHLLELLEEAIDVLDLNP